MKYIITFLLVTGTTFQIVQSDDQFQNTDVWIYPGVKEQIMWLKDIAVGTTSDIMKYDIMNLPSNMKDKIVSVFTHKPSVPNTEMVDGKVSKVKIVTTTVTTDNGEVPTSIIPTDSKTVITTKETETEI
ncbi:uncharacterized protein LOC100168922 [Acyrthosiphon pisum]|uniref:Uncharacterized protein n=1 Tax=Acyrthosiphon pisum TaxID=7029 RepID=A0A8R2A6D9_ACYPI|nr:uncharacterized protein LOC100168922 [Acyrthosiphon pisum]|eukprot:XP_001950433.1 PREDICTED: uncharacterized protein LOC100168922 isoform X1 [Acyrthosiphon pisum]